MVRVHDDGLVALLRDVAAAVRQSLDTVTDWGQSGRKPGQYVLDLAADQAALTVLSRADVGVLSEESGLHHPERPMWVALDPVDGSTNASRRLPWFATSACVVDGDGPRVALVANLATGDRYEAVRGQGATRNGEPIRPRTTDRLADAVVGLTWCPPVAMRCRQMRAMGAAALDICSVAAGSLDAYVDFSPDAHCPWDYLAAVLVCREAGAHIAEAFGREIVTRAEGERRTIVAAATPTLLDEALALRASVG